MGAVGDIGSREDRPAYVTFERVAVEDKAASLREGHYIARDVDYVNVTPPYSKDIWKAKVSQWFDNMKQDVQNGRLPREWMDGYIRKYEAWKNGQEIPLEGTAIKGWGVISPAQQETLIRLNILTVEDLAGVTDEGAKRIGMGAMELKNKAKAWLAQLNDRGPLTLEMAAVKQENAVLKGSIEALTAQVERLTQALNQREARVVVDVPSTDLSDILPEPEPMPSRVPKRKAQDATI